MQFDALILTFIFLFGMMAGSFLNVVIYRLEDKKRKTLGGRSFCPHCETGLKWYDMFPVFSWLALGGKCRECKGKISPQYPLVEFGTGALFAVLGYAQLAGFTHQEWGVLFSVIPAEAGIQSVIGILNLAFWLVFACLFMVIFVFDAKHQIIPDEVIYPALVLGLVYAAFGAFIEGDISLLINHLLAGLLAGGFFFFLVAVSKGKWMGGGDIKLAAFMGLILGGAGVLIALYVSFVLGAVVGLTLIAIGKKKMGSKIAFGPFLVIGTFISLFFSSWIYDFYVRMLM